MKINIKRSSPEIWIRIRFLEINGSPSLDLTVQGISSPNNYKKQWTQYMYTAIFIAVFNSIVQGQYQITGGTGFRAKIDLTGVEMKSSIFQVWLGSSFYKPVFLDTLNFRFQIKLERMVFKELIQVLISPIRHPTRTTRAPGKDFLYG